MTKNIYLLSGLPGSGKSTYAKRQCELNGGVIISRDEIRFSIIKSNEEYFSHEVEVFNKFIENVNTAIKNPKVKNVYIDATHLNDYSRNKTLSKLNIKSGMELFIIIFNVDINTCLIRNYQRTGRAVVPKDIIISMAQNFTTNSKFSKVLYINEKGEAYAENIYNQ